MFGPALHTSELLIHNSSDLIPRGTQCVWRAKGSKGPLLEAVDTNNGWKDTPSTRRHGMVFQQGKRTKKLRPPKVGVCGGLSGICDVRSSHTVRIRSGSLLLDPDSATLRSRPEACMLCFLGWPCNTNGAGFLRQPNCTGMQQPSDQTVKSKMLA